MFYKNYYNMQELLQAGVHYGHSKNLWNPKMAQYIYGVKGNVHIIDLQQTVFQLEKALNALKEVALQNGRILFISTKKQASEIIAEYAQKCGQYYVNHRWLGGMLTNWSTVSHSIKTLREYEAVLADEKQQMTKKERLLIDRKRMKLHNVLGGIQNMGGMPDMIFVIDTNEHKLAIKEAIKLGIPVCAVADTNSNPEGIDYIIPGNDDARKAIEMYCKLAADAILLGMQEGLSKAGIDLGSSPEIAKIEKITTSDSKEENNKNG